MHDVISPEEFEAARLAFAEAWLTTDETLAGTGTTAPGARSTAGLTAALAVLGIAVYCDQS